MPTRFLPPRAACTAFMALCLAAPHAGAGTVTVNTVADTAQAGFCTLREAITAVNQGADVGGCTTTGSNAWGVADTIEFSIGIPGSGPHTIAPSGSELPNINKPVLINGYTQFDAQPNTLNGRDWPHAQGLDTVLRVQIDGIQAGSGANGLSINAAGTTVRGLAIVNFGDGAAIRVMAKDAQIWGNFIGRRADGVTPGPNYFGIYVDHASGAVIGGGPGAGARNLIAQSEFADIRGDTAHGMFVSGNLIGTTSAGGSTGAIQPATMGVWLTDSAAAQIQGNVITDHGYDGIYLAGTSAAQVLGNTIGEGVAGAGQTGGNRNGVVIANSPFSAANALVSSNGITGNMLDGVLVQGIVLVGDPVGNRLDNNAIYANGGIGINLRRQSEGPNLVTPNDPGDGDDGPNGQQNFPVINMGGVQRHTNGSITIDYTLDSSPSTQFEISAYASPVCERGGRYGTGLVNQTVMSDGTGHAAGTITVPAPLPAGWSVGACVSLLAHDVWAANTSEYSDGIPVALAPAGGGTVPAISVPAQNGSVGTAFNLDLSAYATDADSDPITDYAYTGALPPGLSLTNGQITGTPTQAGTYTVQVRAGDKDGWSSPASVQFTIAAAGGNPGGNPGAPGSVAAIPTLSEWGRLLAALLVGGTGLLAARRKAKPMRFPTEMPPTDLTEWR